MLSGMFIGQCGVVEWSQQKGRKPLDVIKISVIRKRRKGGGMNDRIFILRY